MCLPLGPGAYSPEWLPYQLLFQQSAYQCVPSQHTDMSQVGLDKLYGNLCDYDYCVQIDLKSNVFRQPTINYAF